MTTLLYTHPACFGHDPGAGHAECPARLTAIMDALDDPAFADLERREAPAATREQLLRVHPADFIDRIQSAIPDRGHASLDADTTASPGSGEAALRAAGAVCAAVDAVALGEAGNAFCAVRPPGHHAEPDRAMGFCLFNNIAVGALQARAVHGLHRVAVIDFDVHHGNGTQAMFWDDADLFYASTHQMPLYPGTGDRVERGRFTNIVNAPLAPMSGSAEFQQAARDIIFPALLDFRPALIMISAGFDAHEADPLAGLRFQDEDYSWITRELAAIAQQVCEGRLVSALEGGYDLAALASSTAAHVRALMSA